MDNEIFSRSKKLENKMNKRVKIKATKHEYEKAIRSRTKNKGKRTSFRIERVQNRLGTRLGTWNMFCVQTEHVLERKRT